MPYNNKFEELSSRIARFCSERDWEQYHNPKNLSMAVAIEAAELMEIFQWLTPDESSKDSLSAAQKGKVEDEVADIIIYAIRMAQVLDIDLPGSVARKIEKNELKYRVEEVRGKATL